MRRVLGKKKKELSSREKPLDFMERKSEYAVLQAFHDMFFIFNADLLLKRMIITTKPA